VKITGSLLSPNQPSANRELLAYVAGSSLLDQRRLASLSVTE
jgi:hypothetical protein